MYEAQKTDTYYYVIEWRIKNVPNEGWHFVKDRYGNTKRLDTVEEARYTIQKNEEILSSFRFNYMKEFRIVKITKEVIE